MPIDFTLMRYSCRRRNDKMEQELLMKVRFIRSTTYGALITGAIIMILAATLPALSSYMTVVMYIGGAVGVLGMVFCLVSLQFQVCPGCRDFMIIQKLSLECCPCCNRGFQ